jgi:uncharacterized protein YqgC (DUF456 family)
MRRSCLPPTRPRLGVNDEDARQQGFVQVARASRLISHLIGALTVLGIIVSPFVASSVPNAIVRVILWLAAAFGTWLILYVGLPSLLARLAVAILPAQQMNYAATDER